MKNMKITSKRGNKNGVVKPVSAKFDIAEINAITEGKERLSMRMIIFLKEYAKHQDREKARTVAGIKKNVLPVELSRPAAQKALARIQQAWVENIEFTAVQAQADLLSLEKRLMKDYDGTKDTIGLASSLVAIANTKLKITGALEPDININKNSNNSVIIINRGAYQPTLRELNSKSVENEPEN